MRYQFSSGQSHLEDRGRLHRRHCQEANVDGRLKDALRFCFQSGALLQDKMGELQTGEFFQDRTRVPNQPMDARAEGLASIRPRYLTIRGMRGGLNVSSSR
jgi:hypothetical protein